MQCDCIAANAIAEQILCKYNANATANAHDMQMQCMCNANAIQMQYKHKCERNANQMQIRCNCNAMQMKAFHVIVPFMLLCTCLSCVWTVVPLVFLCPFVRFILFMPSCSGAGGYKHWKTTDNNMFLMKRGALGVQTHLCVYNQDLGRQGH